MLNYSRYFCLQYYSRMAALKKVVLKSNTVMSLNERFTYLRQPSVASTSGAATLSVPTARDMAVAHMQHLRPSSQQSNIMRRQPHLAPQQYRQQQYNSLRRRQPGLTRHSLESLGGAYGYEDEDDGFSMMGMGTRSLESPMRGLRSRAETLLPASARNRRLAAQMERRPAVLAALKIKRRSVRQRLGQPFTQSIKDRLTLGNIRGLGAARARRGLRARSSNRGVAGRGAQTRGRGQGTINRRGNLSRSQSLGSLNRSSDNNVGGSQTSRQGQTFRRPFNRGARRGTGTLRSPSSAAAGVRFSSGRGRGTWRGNNFRSRRGIGARGAQRQQRGIRRGARGGRGRGRGGNTSQPTREELDHQLDEYMASTRSHLDKELEQYMNQAPSDLMQSSDYKTVYDKLG
ncbi:hypothetical protein J437_LFUL009571 [Ladona fulva]|uniref:Chromatin target of PRMT1 protein C-terminal domain-containing protein n=1 Tax=Ladona fulva TaxID=123851 RepID=A0A8K0P121_LADFU|nr:hypothetical protein J437_LFUL009571 [Ladona fulva]